LKTGRPVFVDSDNIERYFEETFQICNVNGQ
jgi:hypothetical protein